MSNIRNLEDHSLVLVISNLGLGGAERQAFYLALGLAQRGWKVTIASMVPGAAPTFVEPLIRAGAKVEILQNSVEARLGALLRATAALRRLVRAERPAVIIGFMPHAAVLARLIGSWEKVPKVVTSLRSTRSTRRWHDWVLALTRRLDDAAVANSSAAAEAQARVGAIIATKSVVIHNGFDPVRVACRQVESRSAGFKWLNIAVIRREKDHATLLEATRILREEGRDFELQILGTGPLLEEIRLLTAELGLADMVTFLGQRSDVFEFIANADAFVLSSLWESLPNVLIEAHAGGLPVVCTAVGGCGEIVLNGVSGEMVPPSNPDSLAAAMRRLMDMSVAERARMGEAGRQHIFSTFAMDRMVSAWERVLVSS